jgi:hypothetical protein
VRIGWVGVVARNLVPVVGVLALDWSAPHLLVAYFTDTVLGMATAIALVFSHMFPPGGGEGAEAHYATDLLSHFGTALAVAAVVAVPLGGPVAVLLARGGFDPAGALAEPRFRNGLLLQAGVALVLYARELRAQAGVPLEALRLRERFGLLFVRWFALCALALTPVAALLGAAAAPALVVLYASLTAFGEVAPARMLEPFDGADSQSARAAPPPPRPKRRRGRRRRR